MEFARHALRAAAERGVYGPDLLDHRRIGGAGVLEMHRPLDGWIVTVLDAYVTHAQTALGIAPGQGVLLPLVIQLLRLALQLPLAQEFRRGTPPIDEREGRLRRIRLALLIEQRQVAQPELSAIGQHHLCVRPIRLVARDAIARIANLQRKLAGTVQRYVNWHPRNALAYDLGTESFLPADVHGEDHASASAGGLFVAVHARNGAE